MKPASGPGPDNESDRDHSERDAEKDGCALEHRLGPSEDAALLELGDHEAEDAEVE